MIRDAIANGQLNDAVDLLQDLVDSVAPSLRDSAALLLGRYNKHRRDVTRNVLSRTEQGDQENELAADVLTIASEAQRNLVRTIRLPKAGSPVSEWKEAEIVALPTRSPSPPDAGGPAEEDGAESRLRRVWSELRRGDSAGDFAIVSCDGVGRRFGMRRPKAALDDVSLTLHLGQITAVVGRNASGKTTLLRIVRGELAPDRGRIAFPALGGEAASWTELKRSIAYIPQTLGPTLGQVRVNLNYVAAAHAGGGNRNRDDVEWHLSRFGLQPYERMAVRALSGGFRLRYELVRALLKRPKLLILDEPLASLDVLSKDALLRTLRRVAYRPPSAMSILVTSQHLHEMDVIADQLVVLEEGRTLFVGTADDLRDRFRTKLFEVGSRLSRQLVEERLEGRGMHVVQDTPEGYIIESKRGTATKEELAFLVEVFGSSLVAIRDITASLRRFFVDGQA